MLGPAYKLLAWFYHTGLLDYIRDGMDRDTKDPNILRAQAQFDEKYKLTEQLCMEWTDEDGEHARSMGWCLAERVDTGKLLIGKADDIGAFANDEAATKFVEALASLGNTTCKKALRMLEIENART